ncbi:RHS repeat-associated core domain-containing protein [Melittangium boletus]|uniref:Teneurin-like YD-shell domain-containing protein n=1 Tax=Melittangium boletus DSM 14713 TaxID=1294270 RepID=A0A250IGJ2_9BACT|nr:RHS repeat-associated core domain-containing protein [Melittangium boletus]ATB30277.1 hypothetical protein MEBOL_003737 [Melittangium boletus DSM 14713]
MPHPGAVLFSQAPSVSSLPLRILFPLVVCLATALAVPAHAAHPFADSLIQPPGLAVPQRGSLVGSLAGVAFSASDLSRGGYTLESPFAVPSDQGPLLAPIFPQYSVDQGISEWGMGWQATLALTRFRAVGSLDYATDGLTGPWGELVQGTDGDWYPRGLSTGVRVAATADGFVAYLPDGTRQVFGGAARVQNARGTYSWHLTEVVTATGWRTSLAYEANASGRLFLKTVSFGGVGNNTQYQVEFVYAPVPVPFSDWRSSQALVLDRRVQKVVVSGRSHASSVLRERWHYDLTYQQEALSPAFFLKDVVRVFASGESEPPVRYTYNTGTTRLTSAQFRYVPQFDSVAAQLGWDALYPTRTAPIDVNEDGLVDLEHHESNVLAVQGPTGFTLESLPAASGPVHSACRWAPSAENPVRHLMKLRPEDTAYRVLDLRYGVTSSSTTRLTVCERDGVAVHTAELPGNLESGPNNRLVDLDGDKRPDFIEVFSGGYQVLPNTSTAAGYSFGAPIRRALSPQFLPEKTWLHDMNGDGLLDIVAYFDPGLAVWFGRGGHEFAPEAVLMSFYADGALLGDLSSYQIHFVDVNKDGVSDALIAQDSLVFIFINDGTRFRYIRVPALRTLLGLVASYPMVVDVTGSGDTEVAVVEAFQGMTQSVALNAAETGLLRTADDGKGTVLSFEYGRAPAEAGVRQRATVLKKLVVDSSGADPVTYTYQYSGGRVHSKGLHLLGFDQVVRQAPSLVEQVGFINDDTSVGLSVSSFESDARTPGIGRYSTRSFDLVFFQGLPWRRLKEERSGYTQQTVDGPLVSEEFTEYPAYDDSELCPSRTVRHTAQGTLTTERRRAVVPGLSRHLHCLEDRLILSGQHPQSAFNFHHEAWLTRNAVGLVQRVQSVGEDGLLTLQEVVYRSDFAVESVSVPGRGTTFFEMEPGSFLLRKVTSPDGSVVEVTERDPLTDAIRVLSNQHGPQSYTQSFRYDGQERLQKQWDSLGGATESNPALSFAYQFATVQRPAMVNITTLVEALSGARRQSVEWSTAAGRQVATAQRIPEGWAFEGVTTFHPGLLETRDYNRPTEPASTVPGTVTYQQLHTGLQSVGIRRAAGFGHEVEALSKLHADVERQVVSSLGLDAGLVRSESLENGTWRTRVWRNGSREVVRREQPDGTTYQFERDMLGRLRGVLLPDGKHHGVTHDAYGRVTQVTREGLSSIVYHYAPITGLLSSRVFYSAQGVPQRSETWTYDAIGRRSVELHTDLIHGTTQSYRFFYDGALPGMPSRRTHLGALSAVQGDGYLKTFDHRADGKLSLFTLRLDGWRTVESQFQYAADGEPTWSSTTVREADGSVLSTSTTQQRWDAHGRLSEVLRNGVSLATFGYDGNGQASWASFNTGDQIQLGYDPLTRRRLSLAQTAVAGWNASSAQRLDARGFLARESLVVGGKNLLRFYDYSAQGFLTHAQDAENAYSYTFDGAGLPLSVEDANGHRDLIAGSGSLTAGGTTYTFDALGRTITKGDLTFEYGPNGHLARATRGTSEWGYLYDEAGQRLMKFEGGIPVAAYLESGGYLDANDLTEPFRFAGQLVGLVRGGSFQLLAADMRGSLMADQDGTARLASPFGHRSVHPDNAAVVDYVQKGYDADLGLVRMGVRDYDPSINRFLTSDPLFLEEPERCVTSPVECNLYGYARNNPLRYDDPSGKGAKEFFQGLAMGTTAALLPAGSLLPVPQEQHEHFYVGYAAAMTAGGIVETIQGIGTMMSGAGMVGGGGAASATGVGAVVGVPAAATGVVVIGLGAAISTDGVADVRKGFEVMQMSNKAGAGGGSAPQKQAPGRNTQPAGTRTKNRLPEGRNGDVGPADGVLEKRNPQTGELQQQRRYDSQGKPVKDIDYGHDHGAGDPHVHDWTYESPQAPNPSRQPGRPLQQGETL